MTNKQLRDLVLRELAVIASEADVARLDPAADMRTELDLDSMDVLRFATALHQQLGVEIPEGDYAKIASLRGCIEYLQIRAQPV
jgi:acyl carrier protein